MKHPIPRSFLVLGALMLALPSLAPAQPGTAPRRPAPEGPQGAPGARAELPPMDVTALLNARRALDLTPRQVAQLDSIERSLVAERRQMETRMRAMGDSVRASVQGTAPAPGERADRRRGVADSAMRARMETLRPQMEQMRRRDSASRAAAQRVLTDAQRQQVREMQAEERGRRRGMREARQGGRGGAMRGGPRGGARGGARGPGDARGAPGARGDRGMRPGRSPGAPARRP